MPWTMAVKDPNTPLPRRHVDAYWELVRKSLTEIFLQSTEEADALQQEIEALPYARQDIFYNGEALAVAAGLAEIRPTESQLAQYDKLRSEIYGLPS